MTHEAVRARYVELQDEAAVAIASIKRKYKRRTDDEMDEFKKSWKQAFGREMIDAGLSLSEMRQVIRTNDARRLREFIGDFKPEKKGK